MISSAVFGRYARALADVALEAGDEPRVTSDMTTYREIFRAAPDLLEIFHSPAVTRDAKEKILAELLARYPVGGTASNFLRVAFEHNRLRYFHEIFDHYLRTINARKGIVAAEVTAPAPLDASALDRLRASLRQATGREVTLEVRTDPDLLGGLVVQIGSTVYDGSVRSQLEELRRRLGGE